MGRGGYRPGAGRKPDPSKTKGKRGESAPSTDKQKLRELLSYDVKAKAKMYNDFLVRLGDKTGKLKPLAIAEKKLMDKLGAELAEGLNEKEKQEAVAENLTPLDYMLKVMNDTGADKDRRDRMAVSAAPYMHPRAGEAKGKKETKELAAKRAGEGRFCSGAPPQLKIVGDKK